jgi:tetratricopeptide (TPR) repeat protein
MKLFILSTCSLLILALVHASAQDPIVKERMTEIEQNFENLPSEKKLKYYELKSKVYGDIQKNKFITSMVTISDAQSIFPNDIDLLYCYGLCYATIHDVDSAIQYYNKVLEINPYHVPSRLNLIEINFFAGRYEETAAQIELSSEMLKSRGVKKPPIFDFKYLITITKLSQESPEKYEAEIKRLRGLYTYLDDNPYYYYAKALKEFDKGNRMEGLTWIKKASLIFNNPILITGWNKTLLDTGFLYNYEIGWKKNNNE